MAREAGIGSRVYYNADIDNYMAEARPEWACKDADGITGKRYGKIWRWMCIRSPWRDHVLGDLCQIQEAIQSDGFWLDLFGAPNSYGDGSFDPEDACHCNCCRETYSKRFGRELPKQSDDPVIRRGLYEFSQELRTETIRMFLQKLHSLDENLSLCYNHAGDYWDTMGVRDTKLHGSETARRAGVSRQDTLVAREIFRDHDVRLLQQTFDGNGHTRRPVRCDPLGESIRFARP